MNNFDITNEEQKKHLIYFIIFVSRGLKKKFNQMIKDNNLAITFEEYLAVCIVLRMEGIYQTEFARRMDKDRAGASRIIDSLIKKDFVYKTTDESDNRKYKVFSTKKAKSYDLLNTEKTLIDEVLKEITDESMKTTLETLFNISDHLKDMFPLFYTE